MKIFKKFSKWVFGGHQWNYQEKITPLSQDNICCFKNIDYDTWIILLEYQPTRFLCSSFPFSCVKEEVWNLTIRRIAPGTIELDYPQRSVGQSMIYEVFIWVRHLKLANQFSTCHLSIFASILWYVNIYDRILVVYVY